jgi:hypothetical protein
MFWCEIGEMVFKEYQASNIFQRLGLGIVLQPLLADERLRATP